MNGPGRARWVRPLAWTAAALALALVFIAYRDPHLMVDLAARVWACL